jgi:hypothetical protein
MILVPLMQKYVTLHIEYMTANNFVSTGAAYRFVHQKVKFGRQKLHGLAQDEKSKLYKFTLFQN